MEYLCRLRWVIAEGWIPAGSNGPEPEMLSHETVCTVNTGDTDAQIRVTVLLEDREPTGPFEFVVPARRTVHRRVNDLNDPEPIRVARNYSSVIESSVPVVAQHARLDLRQAENALMSTVSCAT